MDPLSRTEGEPVTKTLRSTWIPASAALFAVSLLLSVAPTGAAAPLVAPKTLELGKGPTIVFVHGLGENRMVWMPTARKLVARHHVVLVDLPGHGDSPLPDPFTLEAAAEELDLVLAKQNPDSTVLIGQGDGGMLALLDLKAHPGRVRGIAAIGTGLKSPLKIDDQEIEYFLGMLDANYDQMIKRMSVASGRDSTEGLAIHAMAIQTPRATMTAYIRALLTADATTALRAFEPPFLFIAPELLFKGGKTTGTMLREHGYPDTTSIAVRRIANAGTLVMQGQPDTLAAVIAEFTDRALAARRK